MFNHSLHAFTIFHIALQFTRRRSFIWSFNINFILSTVDPYSHCKVVIFNYALLALIPYQNLIVFYQSFPCTFVGFNVRVECESLVKNCEDSEVCYLLARG